MKRGREKEDRKNIDRIKKIKKNTRFDYVYLQKRIKTIKVKGKFLILIFSVTGIAAGFCTPFSDNFEDYYQSVYHSIHHRFFEYSDYSYNETDFQDIANLYNAYEVQNNKVNYARIQYLEAFILHVEPSPDYNKILLLIDESLTILTEKEYPAEYAKLLVLQGSTLISMNSRFVEVYHNLDKALHLLKKEDSAFIGLAYNNIALIWLYLSDWENATEYINKAEKTFEDSGYKRSAFFVRSNSYIIHIGNRNLKKILPSIQNDLDHAVNEKDTTSALFLYVTLGNGYITEGMLKDAYECLSEAEHVVERYSKPLLFRKADIYYCLGRLFYFKKEYDKSIEYFEKSLQYVHRLNLLVYETKINYYLSKIYDEYGEKILAYDHLAHYVHLNDSMALQENSKKLQLMKTHAELLNIQQEAKINEQAARIQQTHSLLVILILLLLLLTILFILFYINRKQKLKQLKIEQLNQKLKNEEINNKLEKIELEKQVEEKEREMATTQMLVTEKNKVLNQMLDTFKPYYLSKLISGKIWNEMQVFVSNNMKKEQDWDKSKIHFEKVHPDFYKKLKDYCPDLTENELRLCAYIRIGMRTKEIADMLSIDHKSVISNRYRLKRKLNLDKDVSVDDFVRNISDV